MEKPTVSAREAVEQAGMTIHQYLHQAVHTIDKLFGEGYAHEHPELLAECVRSQTLDYNNCALTAGLYEIAEAISGLGNAIREVNDTLESVALDLSDKGAER